MKRWTLNLLNGYSFRQQLILTFTVGIFFLACASTLIISSITTQSVSNQLVLQGKKITESLARQSALALLYQSPETARDVAQATLAFPDVMAIAIYNADHKQLYREDKSRLLHEPVQWPSQQNRMIMTEDNSDWQFTAPVFSTLNANDNDSPFIDRPGKQELIGYVQVVVTKSTLRAMSAEILRSNILITGGLAGVLLLLLLAITNRLTRPLKTLATTMHEAEDGQISVRAHLDGSVDLQRMESAFNTMMDELENREEELIRARDIALDAARAKGIFAATVSHELRTPMNGVLGMLQLLERSNVDTETRQYVEIATSSAKALLVLIDDILDFTKIESGKMKFHLEDFGLRELAMDIVELLSLQARQKHLILNAVVDVDVPVGICADAGRIRQVLINLMGNAIKFTRSGSITLYISQISDNGRQMLKFKVRDTGIGISEEAQKRIFDSFVQADGSTTRRYGGTGLGLTICSQLVDLMGGELKVASVVNQGSTFWFTLPLVHAKAVPEAERFDPYRLSGLRILVVSAEQERNQVLARVFASWKCYCETVDNLNQAAPLLEQTRADGKPFDLVLMDMEQAEPASLQGFLNLATDRVAKAMVLTDAEPPHELANTIKFLPQAFDSVALYRTLQQLLMPSAQPDETHERARKNNGIRVLVAEDNRANQLVAAGMLERLGYLVEVADDGGIALQKVAESPFDIILMDCHMPVIDGYAATRRIRETEPAGQRMPILAMTAHTDREDRKKCIAVGMDDYLSKPLEFEELEEKLALWLQSTQKPKEVPQTATPSLPPPSIAVPEPVIPPMDNMPVVEAPTQNEFPIDQEKIHIMRERMGDTLSKIIESYVEDIPTLLQRLQLELEAQDLDPALELCHTIRGSSLNLGARPLAALCANLEKALKGENRRRARELYPQLAQEYRQVEAALRDELFPASRKGVRPPPKNRPTILIVDDDRSARFALQGILERDGYSIAEVENGAAAVAFCKERMPELILLDAMMPELDGFQACSRILQLGADNQPIILMITALHDEESIEKAFAAGATDFIPKPVNLTLLRKRVNRLLQSRQAEMHVQQLTHFDSLTSLPNRDMFLDRARELIRRAYTANYMLALLFVDLDHFNLVNEIHGHDAGDLLLKTVGQRLQGCVRETDVVARVSGDEYTVILNRISGPEAVVKVAQKICHTLSQPFSFLNQRIYISASIGISLYPNNGNNIGTLLQHADTALFRAKAKGGGCFQYYEFGMEAEVVRRVELERELRRAVEREELVLFYQPQADINTRTRMGMEALVRWQHPDRGLLPPGEFIGLAEQAGIIHQIGDWVLNEVCRQLAEWRDKGFSPLPVALNVASAQLESGDLVEKVRQALEQHHIEPAWLKLEITENTLVDTTEAIIQQMHALKQMGVALEIDDFGTGYSSLSYLKRFPIDTIKIDRMFIKELPGDHDDAAIVSGVITLAHNLGLAIVAEGVETEAQIEFLQQAGCDIIQGYLLSVPVPVEEVEKMMLARNTSS